MDLQTIKSLDDIRKSDESKYHTLMYAFIICSYEYVYVKSIILHVQFVCVCVHSGFFQL